MSGEGTELRERVDNSGEWGQNSKGGLDSRLGGNYGGRNWELVYNRQGLGNRGCRNHEGHAPQREIEMEGGRILKRKDGNRWMEVQREETGWGKNKRGQWVDRNGELEFRGKEFSE